MPRQEWQHLGPHEPAGHLAGRQHTSAYNPLWRLALGSRLRTHPMLPAKALAQFGGAHDVCGNLDGVVVALCHVSDESVLRHGTDRLSPVDHRSDAFQSDRRQRGLNDADGALGRVLPATVGFEDALKRRDLSAVEGEVGDGGFRCGDLLSVRRRRHGVRAPRLGVRRRQKFALKTRQIRPLLKIQFLQSHRLQIAAPPVFEPAPTDRLPRLREHLKQLLIALNERQALIRCLLRVHRLKRVEDDLEGRHGPTGRVGDGVDPLKPRPVAAFHVTLEGRAIVGLVRFTAAPTANLSKPAADRDPGGEGEILDRRLREICNTADRRAELLDLLRVVEEPDAQRGHSAEERPPLL